MADSEEDKKDKELLEAGKMSESEITKARFKYFFILVGIFLVIAVCKNWAYTPCPASGISFVLSVSNEKTFGFIFEQLCVRDMKAYTQSLYSSVSYYHDRYGLEADFVLHLEDGRYALIECKLGSNEIEDGAAHLLELRDLIRKHNLTEKQMPIREPDLLIIFTGGQMAYTRPDGVKIIPIGCLRD